MKRHKNMIFAVLAVALAVMVVPQAVYAGGTRAGTQVDNTALISWNAGSIGYTTSDTATFFVDELIHLQVTNNGATALTVWPGELERPLAFDVQNAGNSTIDIRVSAVGDGALFVTDVELWYDDGDGTFDSTLDANLGAGPYDTLSIPVDTVFTYFIVADVPASPTTANTPDAYDLLVTAINGAGNAITADNGAAFDGTEVQQIMADDSGTAAGDADYDGSDSARATYNLVWATLSLTKTYSVIDSNPMNSGQHAVPGATVRYRLVVSNSGSAPATSLSITDSTPAGTTFGGVQSASAGTVAGTDPVVWNINSLAAGTSENLVFDVTITGP
jgi:uncharacterized repeat protein (TIGR01451 family)